MSFEALGSISEFVAAIATIVTLAYLALQIRLSTKAQMVATEISSDERAQQNVQALLANPQIANLIMRGNKGEPLSDVDWLQYREWVRSLLGSHQTYYFAYKSGLNSEEHWSYWKRRFQEHFCAPGFVRAWTQIDAGFDKQFQEYVGRELVDRGDS